MVLLNFTMDSGALFRICTETRTRVLTEMLKIHLHKNEVGGYAYNNVNTLLTQIDLILERQWYEDSADGMKGLESDLSNTLNDYKSAVHIKKRDVLAASRAAAKNASTNNSTVEPETANNSDAQDEADQKNFFRLAEIGVKEGIAEGITKIVGKDITNPVLQTTDNIDFKLVDQFQIHQRFTWLSLT